MTPIRKALADLRWSVPTALLNETFLRPFASQRATPLSLDHRINEAVIQSRVIPDCNLGGGREALIPLNTIRSEQIDLYRLVYRIPKSLTQGRSICRTSHLVLDQGMIAPNMVTGGGSALLDAAGGLMASVNGVPMVSNSAVWLVAENTILVENTNGFTPNAALLCYLEYDTEMNHLQAATYDHFSRLVELAVKAYVYNQLVVSVGQNMLSGGMELGSFRSVLDSYADSYPAYQEYIRTVWRRVMIMDDPKARNRHLRQLSPGRR